MSQAPVPEAVAKLPIWATIGDGAKLGFKHFWILVAILIGCYGLMLLLFLPIMGRMITSVAESQRLAAAAAPGDPRLAMAQFHQMASIMLSPSMLAIMLISMAIGAVMIILVFRVVALGPREAFTGSPGIWGRRFLLLIWREICTLGVMIVVITAFALACLLIAAAGAILAKVLPGFVMGLLSFVFVLAVLAVGALLYALLYAVMMLSYFATSCDERVTLRGAFSLLRGNRLRAGGVHLLIYVILMFTIFVLAMILSFAGVVSVFSSGIPPTPEAGAAMASGLTIGMILVEFIVLVPGMVWWFGVAGAVYNFVTDHRSSEAAAVNA